MIEEGEAQRQILKSIQALPARRVPVLQALDGFAAEDYLARLPLPNFDNSAMDGYAIVASSCRTGGRLRVIGEQPAGVDRGIRISAGEAARIFTGAPMPAGADAVVMQEDITRDGDEIVLNGEINAGDFVRRRGCDLSEGQKILSKGERIRPATVALLASQGFSEIAIGGEADVAIISTGDELVKPGTQIQPGQIYESNSALLNGLLQRCGASVKSVEHCGDEPKSLAGAIKRGIRNRILIISGGVSVGERDLVKDALSGLGAQVDIWRVAIKPGKPFLFGQIKSIGPSPLAFAELRRGKQSSPSGGEGREAPGEGLSLPLNDCAIFGLPGNPVSAFVTFLQFVRPAILKMLGATNLNLPLAPAELVVDLTNDGDRPHYVRGKLQDGKFAPVGRQESHALFGLSQSNALLRLAPGYALKNGALVKVQLLD